MKHAMKILGLLFVVQTVSVERLPAADGPRVLVNDLTATDKFIGRRVDVEGRVASRAPDRLRLEQSDVDFRFTPSPEIAPFTLQRVLIEGTLVRKGNGFRFDVESLHTLPSEQEEFRNRRDRVQSGDAKGWYALGQWARERAVLYNDPSLAELADDAYRGGLSAEERRAGDRPDALLKLSGFARDEAGLADEATRLMVRAYQVQLVEMGDNVDALTRLAERIADTLPGYDQPLTSDDADLARRAARNLDLAYRGATAADRRKLHRLLWADVTERRFKAEAAAADEQPERLLRIAAQVAEALPDRPELAQILTRRALDRQSRDIRQLSREQVVEVAEGYRSLASPAPERAREVLEAWVEAQRERLGASDADGRLALARDALAMLGDRQQAVVLLKEAWKLAPELPGVADELRGLGLVRVGTTWSDAAAASRNADAEMERLIRRGQVVPGMTDAQVLRSLRAPDHITRIGTSRHIVEQWIFTGSVTMRVNLVRQRGSGSAEVISVHSGF